MGLTGNARVRTASVRAPTTSLHERIPDMASIGVWSITVTDDGARLLATLVNAVTSESQEVQGWYAEDQRNGRIEIDPETSKTSVVDSEPVYESRDAAGAVLVDSIRELLGLDG